jgi:hypothetical protein
VAGYSDEDYDPDEHLLSEEDADEDADAVHSRPQHSRAAAAAAAAAESSGAAGPARGTSEAPGRYNLRQHR